jgi:cysteinyl-tRNA synthetase
MPFLESFRAELTEEDISTAISKRAEARANKDYAAADVVRDEMESKGILIMDTPAGTTWRPSAVHVDA